MYSQFEMETTMKIDDEVCKSGQQQPSQNGDVIEPSKKGNDDDDDEWSNFQDCDASADDDKIQEFSKTKSIDAAAWDEHINNNNKQLSEDNGDIEFSNFASFDDQNVADNQEVLADEDDFDDFDDFVSADQPVMSESVRTIEPEPTKSVEQFRQLPKSEEQLAGVFKQTFPLEEDNIPSCGDENTISRDIFEHADSASSDIWEHLQTIDVTAFGFHDRWRESESFNLLLSALKIDKRLVVSCFEMTFIGLITKISISKVSPWSVLRSWPNTTAGACLRYYRRTIAGFAEQEY